MVYIKKSIALKVKNPSRGIMDTRTLFCDIGYQRSVVQNQQAVSDYFTSYKMLRFGFADHRRG